MKKRYFAIFLALIVAMVTVPFEAFATTNNQGEQTPDSASPVVSEDNTVLSEEPKSPEERVPDPTDPPEENAVISITDLKADYVQVSGKTSDGYPNGSCAAHLTWNYDGEESFFVWIEDDEESKIEVTDKEYTFEGLQRDVEYTFCVAYVKDGVELEDATVSIEAGAEVDQHSPAKVSGLKAGSSYNSVDLTWKANAEDEDLSWVNANDFEDGEVVAQYGYIVKGSNDKKTYKQIAKLVGYNKNKYSELKLPVRKVRYYQVYATKTIGDLTYVSEQPATCSGEPVKNCTYKVTFKATKTLTSHTGGKVKHTFKKGETVEAVSFANGKYIFYYGGRQYQALKVRMKNAKVGKCSTTKIYTKAEAESFVNRAKLSSKTSYLIWVNTFTQREYIFKKVNGKWVGQNGNGWQISTGKPSTPTAIGATKIKSKYKKRRGISYWNICNVYSIHAKLSKWKLGWPRSGGCVRNTNDHAKWIYSTCKKYTRVYTY